MAQSEFEKYGTLYAWSSELGLSQDALTERVTGLRGVEGRSNGRIRIFYSESDIRQRCMDLLRNKINDDGEITIDGVSCVVVRRFSEHRHISASKLKNAIEEAGLIPFFYIGVGRGQSSIAAYEKSLVEKLDIVCLKQCFLNEEGEVTLDGTVCIGIYAFARAKDLDGTFLQKAVDEAKLKSIGKARSGLSTVDVYEREQIEKLQYVLRQTRKLDENGEVVIKGVRCVGIVKYADVRGIARNALLREVRKAKLPIIGEAHSGNLPVAAFEKAAVEQLYYSKCHNLQLDEKGEVRIGDMIGIGVWKYAKHHGLGKERLQRHIQKAGLAVIGQGTSNQQIIDLFEKQSVEQLPYVRERLTSRNLNSSDASNGDNEIEKIGQEGEVERYTTKGNWAKVLGISEPSIEARLPVEKGIQGRDRLGRLRIYYAEVTVREACADLLQDLPQADEQGFFIDSDGMKYGTRTAWAREKNFSESTLTKRMQKMIGRPGKDQKGHLIEYGFFSERQVLDACQDLLEDMPQANETGFIVLEERYATATKWAKVLNISKSTLEGRLDGVKGMTGKSSQGRVIREGFFKESYVTRVCSNLQKTHPQADDHGFFTIEESNQKKLYGHTLAWAKKLHIPEKTLRRKLPTVEGILSRSAQGKPLMFYAEDDVLPACAEDLHNGLPQADATGFFTIEKEGKPMRFGAKRAWARELGITHMIIRVRLGEIKGVTGRLHNNVILSDGFYAEDDVRHVCAELLQDIPKADINGFFMLNGERYGTYQAWERELHLSRTTIRRYLSGAIGLTGKNAAGLVFENGFFSESVVRSVCSELLREIPQADEKGFIDIDDVRYGTVVALREALGISEGTIASRIRKHELQGITGKDRGGRVQINGFFDESKIRDLCDNLPSNDDEPRI